MHTQRNRATLSAIWSKSMRPTVLVASVVLVTAFAAGCRQQLAPANQTDQSWSDYGGGPSNSHYVATRQITKDNVNQLKVAWTYPTRDHESYLFNPVVVRNVVYVLARNTSLVALDATTGKEIWVHENLYGIAPRGINYWESSDHEDRRLIFQMNNTLQEIDAQTGKSILNFGNDGFVDLRQGLGRDPKTMQRIQSNNPGKVFENLLLLGSATGEGYLSPPGDLRAFDILTGKVVWQFHTVPHPGEPGYDTWPPNAWKYIGGTNTWGEITVDAKRGIAYFPVGSPTYDFYGADRHGNNLFATCLLAIDARTGKLIWYFQGVHHDLWDYDFTAAPQLLTLNVNGKIIDAVAQSSKQGFVYVFDRVTGKPVFPIEERPVPKSDVPGEQSSPTQPFPTVVPPFARQKFTVDDLNPYLLTPKERADWKEIIEHAKNGGLFTQASLDKITVAMPGDRGGSIWGMTSSDPSKGVLYVASIDTPFFIKLQKGLPKSFQTVALGSNNANSTKGPAPKGQAVYAQNCQACHGGDRAGNESIPSLQHVINRLGAETVYATVRNGRGQMPPFPSVTDAQLAALISYLQTADGGGGKNEPLAEYHAPSLGGPVVASGGAPAARAYIASMPSGLDPRYGMSGGPAYPPGSDAPAMRLYTGFDAHREIISPPWSSLTAYDLNTGTIKWKIPYGEDPLAVSQGIHNTGIMQDQRSVLVTPTGLLFAATTDGYLRALDADTGKVLWSAQLPASSYGIPAMYVANGKTYIIVGACASRNSFGLPANWKLVEGGSGAPRAYVAFALPDK